MKKQEEEEQRLRREKHHEEIVQRIEHHKEKEQEKEQEPPLPPPPNREYMHEKLEKKYKENIEIPALQQKKIQLDQLRNFYRPIKREELDEHEKNFLQQLKLKQDEKRFKREQEYKNMGIGVS